MLTVAGAGSAAAAVDPWDDCVSKKPQVSVQGCTAVIDSGKEKGQNLALAFNNRALAYFDQGDYVQSLVDFTQAIQINPQFAKAYVNRGNAYLNLDNFDQAEQDFSTAIQIDPTLAEAYTGRGLIYETNGKTPAAISDYQHALALDPSLSLMQRKLEILQGGGGGQASQ